MRPHHSKRDSAEFHKMAQRVAGDFLERACTQYDAAVYNGSWVLADVPAVLLVVEVQP